MNGGLKQALTALRWPLIVLMLACLAGTAMVVASMYLQARKDEQYQQVQNRLRAAQLALNNARREESDLEAYHSRYESLSVKGVFGREQRLNWVEHMNDLAARGLFQSLNYEIATQHHVTLAPPAQAESVDILSSRIQLRMGFVHEGDIVRTLEDLHRANEGFYRIDACAVVRKDAAAEPRFGENLTADCKLQWITMRPRMGKG